MSFTNAYQSTTKATHIRILRSIQDSKKDTDDVIHLHKHSNGLYCVDFDAHDIKSETRQLILSGESFADYLDNMFVLLAEDASPFPFIQIDFPCSPSVQYKPSQFKDDKFRNTVIDSILLMSNTMGLKK